MDFNESYEYIIECMFGAPRVADDGSDYDYYTSFAYIHAIVVAYVIFPVIFLFGLVGNMLVVCSVLRDKSKRTVTNVFMFNLAVANILLCLFVIPIRPVHLFAGGWQFGSFVCNLLPSAHNSLSYASMVILACIAVNRYSVVVHRLPPEMQMTKWMVITVIIWIVSILVSVPFGIGNEIQHYQNFENYRYTVCAPTDTKKYTPYYYFLSVLVLFFLIPLIVTASFYTALSVKTSRMSTADRSTEMADNRRTNRLLIAMATVFCVVLMPYHIIELLYTYFWESFNYYHLKNALDIAYDLAMTSTCFCPLFYIWLNKVAVKQVCLFRPCFNKRGTRPNSEDQVKSTATAYMIVNDELSANDVTYNAHCNRVRLI